MRIAARHSDLARLQAYRVADALKAKDPKIKVEFNFRASLGDQNLVDPLWKMPERGVFTEDFVGDLTEDRADLVVHSWKDLPTETRVSTTIAATLARADVRDLFLMREDRYRELIAAAGNAPVSVGAERRSGVGGRARALRILTSSPRRAYNLEPFFKSYLPFDIDGVDFQNVRGNIPTRLRKLMESPNSDGLILAKAALDRLLAAPEAEFSDVKLTIREVLKHCRWMVLPLTLNPTAAAQGALAVEIHRSRRDLKKTLDAVHDKATFDDVQVERQILASYGGGCHQKIGVTCLSRAYGQLIFLRGFTDAGEVLNSVTLRQTRGERHELAANELWPARGEKPAFFKRVERSLSDAETKTLSESGALWVARESAWPKGYIALPETCVWTSGLKTWESLAQKGVWVHGSAESLGENEDPRVEVLLGSRGPQQWLRLSHDTADALRSRATDGWSGDEMTVTRRAMMTLATYTLVPLEVPASEILKLKAARAFFWSSISQFERARELCPEIMAGLHACGPGATADHLRGVLSKVDVYLSYDDWRSDLEPSAR